MTELDTASVHGAPVDGPPAGFPMPGQPPHPTATLGLQYNPFDPGFRADPHVFFDRARVEAPVCFNPIFGMWVVTGHEHVMRVCTDNATFSSGNKIDPPSSVLPEVLDILNTEGFPVALQLFNTDPPNHARLRSLVGQGFTTPVLEAFTPSVRHSVAEWVQGWVGADEVDLYPRFTNPMPLQVILDFIGVPPADHDAVRAWDDAWARLFTSADAIDDQLAAVREVVAYQRYLDDLVDQRRARPQDDMLSRCVHARRGDYAPLTNQELVWQVMGLLAAGHATTTDALTHLLLVLLRTPELWSAFVAGDNSADSLVEEGLRYVNPVLGLPRITTREVELGGVVLPEGAEVLVSFCAANRDASYVSDPATFDPARADVTRHLGFGWGTHQCIGARLAKIMMTAALEELAVRTPRLRLAGGYEPAFTQHPFLWGVSTLRVVPGGGPGRSPHPHEET